MESISISSLLMNANGTVSSGTDTSASEAATSERIEAIRRSAGSSPEEMLALASLDVEEAAGRSRATRRLDRKASGQHRRGAIAKRRSAAKLKMFSQIVSSVGTMAASVATAQGGSDSKLAADTTTALTGAYSGFLGERSAQLDQDAAMLDLHADEAKQRASDSGEHADALDRHQGKLMQGTESISRLRHEAMMASIRG